MSRPESITNEDLLRWDETIDNDPFLTPGMAQNAIIREMCYAGQWLADKLNDLNCPDHLVGRIMYTAGRICFGRKDPWEVHQDILTRFVSGTLEFELDPEETN